MVSFGWIVTEVLALVVLALCGVYVYVKYVSYNFWRKRGVPYEEPLAPFGNLFPAIIQLTGIGEIFQKSYERMKHYRFYGTYTFSKANLVVVDPDLVRFVLAKEFASFHDRGIFCNEETDPLSGHLFLLPGKKWRNLRVKLTPTFTSGKIKQMFDTLKDSGDLLIKHLEDKAKKRATIEIKDIFARFSTDIIMSTAFGINSNTLENSDSEFRYWGKKVFEPRPIFNALVAYAPQVLDFFRMPFTPPGVTKFFTKVFDNTVAYRRKNNIVRRDFLSLIIQLMENGYVEADDDNTTAEDTKVPQKKFTNLEGAAQAYVFYLAGFETSSTAVTFCLYELALHQDLQDKARKEVDEVLKKHGGLTYSAVNEMPYLQKVLSETMRKYPALPVLNRICTKPIEMPLTERRSVLIPEGTLVAIPVLGLHRDPDIYPDPDKFDPERFTDENIANRHPYVYLPFGEGPRICIGMRFGLVQTKVALASVLSKFRFKPTPDTPHTMEFDVGSLVTTPKGTVELIIEPR